VPPRGAVKRGTAGETRAARDGSWSDLRQVPTAVDRGGPGVYL
jgi:hypothetical protein